MGIPAWYIRYDCNIWHYGQIHKITKFEMNNKTGNSNWFPQRVEKEKTLTEEVSNFSVEFFIASSSELPLGEVGEM